jgi:uncharacterized protein
MRIAIDIDSTLHDYWPELERAARERYGIAVPYADQHTWAIAALDREQLRAVIADTHADDAIARAAPYPHAVETINRWRDDGHWIHVTSHRTRAAAPATDRWLRQIGLRHHDLHCSYDKLARCRELGIELIIDDSPDTLERALLDGLRAATLLHPWNRALCAREPRIVAAEDWPALAAELERRGALGRRAA